MILTLSQLDAETLDHLLKGNQTNRGEKGLPGVIAVPVCYYPRLWNSTTIFLCVSSFRASSIWLRTPHGDPFIGVYEVVAEVVQPQAFVAEIVSVTAGTNMTMTTFATNQTVGQS